MLFALFLLMVMGAVSPPTGRSLGGRNGRDAELWQNVIDRMRAGDGYYSAMNQALRTTGRWALRPFTNFRLPVLATVTALCPSDGVMRAVLLLLAFLVAAVWTLEVNQRLGPIGAGAAFLLLMFPVVSATTVGFLFHDLWAGVLIALSIGLYCRSRPASVLCGLTALAIREQAIVFVVVMCGVAVGQRRKREAAAWFLGLAAFAGYLALHAHAVSGYLSPADPAKSWVGVQGWPFVIATGQWSVATFFLPHWGLAIAVPLALVGASAFGGEVGTRLAFTLFAYAATFMCVGNPDNAYWGLLYSTLLTVGLIYSLPALRDLAKAARAARRPAFSACGEKIGNPEGLVG